MTESGLSFALASGSVMNKRKIPGDGVLPAGKTMYMKKKKPLLFKYLARYKSETVLAPTFKMLEALFELFVPLVVASIIDRGIRQHDRGYVLLMALLMLLLAVIGLVCSITAQYFAAKSAVGSCSLMREDLFSHIMGLDYAGIDRIGTSTLLTRISSDINQVQNGINLSLRLFLRSPFIVFGAMVMAFTIDPGITGLFAGAILLLFLVVFGVMFITHPIYRKIQGKLDDILTRTRENLSGVRVIRAFRMEDGEEESFRKDNDILTRLQKLAGRISGLMNPLTTVIINYAIILLIYEGAVKVEASFLSLGQVVALYNYMSQILVELIKLANLIVTVTRSIACYSRLKDVFAQEASIREGDKDQEELTENAVEFRNVSFTYERGADRALSHISFCVKRGEVIGIIGGTGAGKSTLVQLIPRFYDPGEGQVVLFGRSCREWSEKTLTGLVSVVPQKAQLFRGSIRDNLTLGAPDASDREIEEALRISQAKEFVDKLPQGLESEVSQGGKNYSGGQKQRLTIARALVRRSPILILDDSASALDYATDAKLRKALREMEGRTTIFIVSQRASAVMGSDRILVLHDGKLVGQGKHRDLLDHCQIYREIYDSQTEKEGDGS